MPSLALAAREYLHAQRDCQARLETSKALSALSPSLQVEIIMEVQKDFFDRVAFLKHAEAPCCVQISLAMHSGVFAPGELASKQHLYVIERGVVLYRGQILNRGKVWGDDDLLLPDGLMKYARVDRARAMTYMEYRSLSREGLQLVLEQFPVTRRQLRKRGIYVALARHLVALADVERLRRGEPVKHPGSYRPGLLDSIQAVRRRHHRTRAATRTFQPAPFSKNRR